MLEWRACHDKWFTLYSGRRIIGFIAGNLNQFDCDWRVIKPGPKFSITFKTSVEAAKALLREAKGGPRVEVYP